MEKYYTVYGCFSSIVVSMWLMSFNLAATGVDYYRCGQDRVCGGAASRFVEYVAKVKADKMEKRRMAK